MSWFEMIELGIKCLTSANNNGFTQRRKRNVLCNIQSFQLSRSPLMETENVSIDRTNFTFIVKTIIDPCCSSCSRICRAPSTTCPPARRGPWARGSAPPGCPAVRVSRATLHSRPSLRTLRPTCQAFVGPRHHLWALRLASPPPAPALCPLLLCQVKTDYWEHLLES